jgi:hypothetical protein
MKEQKMDSGACGERTGKMWLELAEQIAAALPDHVIADDPVKAIHWATCAEACFWKATGECDAHDVKDVLPVGFGIKPSPVAL